MFSVRLVCVAAVAACCTGCETIDESRPLVFVCVTAAGDTLRATGIPTMTSRSSARGWTVDGGWFSLNNCALLEWSTAPTAP